MAKPFKSSTTKKYTLSHPEFSLVLEALQTLKVEIDTLVQVREWYVADAYDLLESALEKMQNKQNAEV